MRTFVLLVTLFLCYGAMAQTAAVDTLAPYQKNKKLPNFNLLALDGQWYDVYNSNKEKNTAIIVFSPDCHHCEIEAEELSKNLDKLKNIDFLWVTTSGDKEGVMNFSKKYGFDNQPNFKFFRDPNFATILFYEVRTTPFTAIYNNKGTLKEVFRNSTSTANILKAVK